MQKKKLIIIAVLAVTLASALIFYAQKMSEGKVSVISYALKNSLFQIFGPQSTQKDSQPEEKKPQPTIPQPTIPQPKKTKTALPPTVSCEISRPEGEEIATAGEKPGERTVETVYDAEFAGVVMDQNFGKNEVFKVVMAFRNTGNMPWFSVDSKCFGNPILNLGTDRVRDRSSIFMHKSPDYNTAWIGPNRIKMKNLRVEPGEIGYFEFWSKTPDTDEIFMEHFTPVVEGISWLENAHMSIPVRVGEYDPVLEERIAFALSSRILSDFDIEAEKSITIDISEQNLYLKIGGYVLHKFPVSTGAARTPTPYGTTRILSKQDVRVGAKWPHYVMPRFLMFRQGGYGIHALPSLRNDGGVFWTEALNHIQRRVSHGCVRLLPNDAEVAYRFANVGTPVTVQP